MSKHFRDGEGRLLQSSKTWKSLRPKQQEFLGSQLREGYLAAWDAWGAAIEKRPYLRECLLGINDVFTSRAGDPNARWLVCGDLTRAGHPHHPLYLPANAPMREFDVCEYALALKH